MSDTPEIPIMIHGHHIEITHPLEQKVKEKLKKLQRFFDHITSIHVTLTVEGNNKDKNSRQEARGVINLPRGGTIVASASTDDMYATIDDLAHKLETQIKKFHDKMKGHHREEDHIEDGEF